MFTTKFHLKEHELHSGYVAMTSNLKRVQHNKMTYPVNHGLTDSSRQSWDNRINTRDSHGATERLILTIMLHPTFISVRKQSYKLKLLNFPLVNSPSQQRP